jgi:hypothetical protein
MQNNPNAPSAYPPLANWNDPTFSDCFTVNCPKTWGLRIFNSTYIFVYGAGLYSFFNNYDSGCLATINCQQKMNKWPRNGPGRPAVRLISDNTYTHGLFVLDLSHMPYGCGTWPAFWLLGPDWPTNGEIGECIFLGVYCPELTMSRYHRRRAY